MRTLQIEISEDDFSRFGFENSQMSFDDFIKSILMVQYRNALTSTQNESKLHHLDQLTLSEINDEILAVRKND